METCAEGDAADCGPVLMTDMAVKCWAGDHLLAAAFAAVVLVLVALVIPAVLLRDAALANAAAYSLRHDSS